VFTSMACACYKKDLFLEQAEGYIKVLEKSTSLPLTMREFFDTICRKTRLAGKG